MLTAVSSLNCDVFRPAARLTVVQHLARPPLGPRAMSDAWDAPTILREKKAALLAGRLKRKKEASSESPASSKKRKTRQAEADNADDDALAPRDVAEATSVLLCMVPEYNTVILVGSECVGLGGDAFGRKALGSCPLHYRRPGTSHLGTGQRCL